MNDPLTKLYVAIGVAILIAAALGYHFIKVAGLEGDVAKLEGQRAQLQATNKIFEQENKTCAGTVLSQNHSIELLTRQAADRAAAAKLAQAEGDRQAAKNDALAAVILGRDMSKPGDACGSFEALLDEEIGRRSK